VKRKNQKSSLVNLSPIMWIVSLMAVDQVIIQLFDWFIFDLKDVYAAIASIGLFWRGIVYEIYYFELPNVEAHTIVGK